MLRVFTSRPRAVSALATRSEGPLAVSRCSTTWAGAVRAFSDAAMRTSSVPLLDDRHCIGIASKQAGERVGDLTVVDPPEPLIGQVLEARHEVDAEKMAQAPQGLGKAMRILWPRSARKGDYIHQPGPIDNPLFTGETRVAVIAEATVFSRVTREGIDAGYAEILPDIGTRGNVIPEGVPGAGTSLAPDGRALTVGDRVAKIGRGTGYTTGRIAASATKVTLHSVEHTRIWSTRSAEVADALVIDGDAGPFSGAGDTGAIVFRLDDFVAVGLLFGSSRAEEKTYAHDLAVVLRTPHLRWL